MTLPAVLAVDGGNSKTDLALIGIDGSLLASVRGPGIAGAADMDATLKVFASLIERAQQKAGLAGRPAARHMSVCAANADLPEEEDELAAALRKQDWTHTTELVNDTFAVLWAGLIGAGPGGIRASRAGGTGAREQPHPAAEPGMPPPPARERHWGIAVTCGAGINCVGVAPDGRSTRFLALGAITGDWGGGYGLGLAALWWAMRAEDGRGPATSLRQAVAAHFGVATVTDVAIGLHKGTIAHGALLGLAPLVVATAGSGDEIAARLLRRQAEEICALALTAMRRLDLIGLATPVLLGGGVMRARDPLLISGITTGIAREAPGATVRIVDMPPVVGAALRGLDRLGAGPAAEQRLRDAYPQRPG